MGIVKDAETGLQKVLLATAKGTTAEVYVHGAHVTSFKPHSDTKEVIFVSAKAIFKPPKAIRGGVPVCWPQFNDMGETTSHGFARNSAFEATDVQPDSVLLTLKSSQETRDKFSHDFELTVFVQVSDDNGGQLTQTVKASNTGDTTMKTTQALHTYFAVSDIADTVVTGLEGCPYHDNLDGRKLKQGNAEAVTFSGEVDRIYKGAGDTLAIVDTKAKRRILLQKEGFSDAVLWNPWIERARSLADFEDEEYKRMVCIEPANAALYLDGAAVQVPAGHTWEAKQTITIEPLDTEKL